MRNKVQGLQFITSPTLTSRLCGYGHPAAWAVGLRMVLSNMLSCPERIFNTCRGEVMWSSESLRLSPSPKRSEVIPYSTLLKLEFIIFYPFSLKGLYKLCLLPHKTWVFPAHKQVRTSAMQSLMATASRQLQWWPLCFHCHHSLYDKYLATWVRSWRTWYPMWHGGNRNHPSQSPGVQHPKPRLLPESQTRSSVSKRPLT